MMSDEVRKRSELFNPLASFFIEGESDKPDTYLAIVELYGEDGERVQLYWNSSHDIDIIVELLQRASQQLEFAEENGIDALADSVGRAEDDELTVEDILNHRDDESD
jgi:hypothetical protein